MKYLNIFKKQAVLVTAFPSEKELLIKRIQKIRQSGSCNDGIHTMRQTPISQDDYFLMECDCSSAKRNYPDISHEERTEGRWFTGGNDLDGSRFWNSHSTKRDDGTWHVDSFYRDLPKIEYQSTPQEVVWHYMRVKELRISGISNETRLEIMSEEAKQKPWIKLCQPQN